MALPFIMNFTSKTENDSFDYPVIQENIQRKVKMFKLGSLTQGSKDRSKDRSEIFSETYRFWFVSHKLWIPGVTV